MWEDPQVLFKKTETKNTTCSVDWLNVLIERGWFIVGNLQMCDVLLGMNIICMLFFSCWNS